MDKRDTESSCSRFDVTSLLNSIVNQNGGILTYFHERENQGFNQIKKIFGKLLHKRALLALAKKKLVLGALQNSTARETQGYALLQRRATKVQTAKQYLTISK